MSYQEIYKSNYSRIVRESVLKSIVYGSVIGLGVAIVIALATMFIDFNGIWLALGACVAVAVALSLTFYFVKFRPTQKYVAERFDRMGFDERFITMLELEGDESFIAQAQRADTVAAITAAAQKHNGEIAARTPAEKLAAVGLTTRNIIIAVVVFVVAVVSLSFTALPNKRVREIFNAIPSYNVEFSAGENGFLTTSNDGFVSKLEDGNFRQEIKEGDSSVNIVVTANDGFVFAGWDDMDPDDKVDPSRLESNVHGAFKASAKYEQMEEPEDEQLGGNGGGEGDGNGDPGESNPDAPSKEGEGGQSNEFAPPQEGGNGNGSSGGGSANGEIIDGETDYKENFEEAYEAAMKMLAEGKDIPPALRKLIESYFNGLK